jgi:hypothetical protein
LIQLARGQQILPRLGAVGFSDGGFKPSRNRQATNRAKICPFHRYSPKRENAGGIFFIPEKFLKQRLVH